MKLRQSLDKPLAMINVSRDVYDILETTGFTELLDVKKALREVSAEGCEEIGSGGYGTVYRIDEETILKVYNTAAPELIDSERIMSQRAFVNGLPTAIPYDVVKVGDKLGVVYEMLEAKTVAQLITADPSRLEKYVRLTTSNLKRFHSVEIHDKAFPNKKQLFYDMLESISAYVDGGEYGIIKGYLDSIPDRSTFLHGDYNFKNVMLKGGELMLIDIGDASVGHPAFDLAGVQMITTLVHNARLPYEEIKRLVGFEPELLESVWKIVCSEYFGAETAEELQHYSQMLMPMNMLNMSYHSLRIGGANSEEAVKARVDGLIRARVLPVIKNVVPIDF